MAVLISAFFPNQISQAAFQPQLTRYPYLTDLVGPYATINFATDRSQSTARVRWGEVGVDATCTAHTVTASSTGITIALPGGTNLTQEYQWIAQLTLQPGRQYCYRIYQGSSPEVDLLGSDPSPIFSTQVPAGSTQAFKFIVFGDWGGVDDNGLNPYQAALIASMANQGARFALTVGDNVYTTTGTSPYNAQSNYGDLLHTGPSTSAVFGTGFWSLTGSSLPIFPATGNHGFTYTNTTQPFSHFLNFPQDHAVALSGGRYQIDHYEGLNSTIPADYPSAWYAFDAGIARFYILEATWADTNVGTADVYQNDYDYHWTAGSAEYEWLKADLQAHPGGLKFAIFHFPLYSDNKTESSDTWLQGSASLEGLLASNGVQIAFNGHAHIYQRNHKPNANSLITYITGGGGAKLEPADNCTSMDAYAIGWTYTTAMGSACGSAPVPDNPQKVFHYLVVAVNGTQVTVTPVNASGQTFDQMTYSLTAGKESNPPSDPSPLAMAGSTSTTLTLDWTPSSDDTGVRGYTVYRNGQLWAVTDVATTTFKDTGLDPKADYSYQVDAFDGWGNHSVLSNVVALVRNVTPPKGIFLPFITR